LFPHDVPPDSSKHATKEESLSGEEILGEQLLEEADSAPRCADGAGYESGVAEDCGGEAVECCDGGAIKGFVGRDI